MKLRLTLAILPILLAGCGGVGDSANDALEGDFRFRSLSVNGSSTNCPGTVTDGDMAYTCGYDTISFDGNGSFTAYRNGSYAYGSYTYYESGSIQLIGGGESKTGNADLSGDTLTLRFTLGSNEVWTLDRTD